ncbi:MAG: hypothetical protein ACTH0M_09465 [Brevibacterium yomogidense]
MSIIIGCVDHRRRHPDRVHGIDYPYCDFPAIGDENCRHQDPPAIDTYVND